MNCVILWYGITLDVENLTEASELFGQEREDGLAALIGMDQTVFGSPARATAAHS